MTSPPVGIIGRGRVATHLAHYLELESIPASIWHRGMRQSPEEILEGCDPILILISDDAIEPFVDAHPFLYGRRSVHFSGSKVVADIPSLHPLMTFGEELYELEIYRAVPFIEEKGGLCFKEVFPSLKNPSYRLDKELKPLYHALCVMAGNFTVLLWTRAFEAFEDTLGLPRSVLLPYLEQTCGNVKTQGAQALTGPLSRRDWKTVAENIRALQGDPFESVYRAFAKACGFRGDTI